MTFAPTVFAEAVFSPGTVLPFVIGDYSFAIVSHDTVIRSGQVLETFVVDSFFQGQPIDMQVGTGNRETFIFSGKEVLPIHDVDGNPTGLTKRGADYRSSLWRTLYRRAEKAHVAQVVAKRIGQVEDSELSIEARTEPATPVALRSRSFSEAADTLLRGRS